MLQSATIAAKMDSRLIFVVIGVIAMAFGRSEAITCYSCESTSDSKCLDPFKSEGVNTCQGATCTKGWVNALGMVIILFLSLHHSQPTLIYYSLVHLVTYTYTA